MSGTIAPAGAKSGSWWRGACVRGHHTAKSKMESEQTEGMKQANAALLRRRYPKGSRPAAEENAASMKEDTHRDRRLLPSRQALLRVEVVPALWSAREADLSRQEQAAIRLMMVGQNVGRSSDSGGACDARRG